MPDQITRITDKLLSAIESATTNAEREQAVCAYSRFIETEIFRRKEQQPCAASEYSDLVKQYAAIASAASSGVASGEKTQVSYSNEEVEEELKRRIMHSEGQGQDLINAVHCYAMFRRSNNLSYGHAASAN